MYPLHWRNLHKIFDDPHSDEELAGHIANYLTNADWQNWNFVGLCTLLRRLDDGNYLKTRGLFAFIDADAIIGRLIEQFMKTRDTRAREVLANAIYEWDGFIRYVILRLRKGKKIIDIGFIKL